MRFAKSIKATKVKNSFKQFDQTLTKMFCWGSQNARWAPLTESEKNNALNLTPFLLAFKFLRVSPGFFRLLPASSSFSQASSPALFKLFFKFLQKVFRLCWIFKQTSIEKRPMKGSCVLIKKTIGDILAPLFYSLLSANRSGAAVLARLR